MSPSLPVHRHGIATLAHRAWAFHRPLVFTTGLMLVLLAGTLVGLALDPRVITGAPAWLKPAKFAISIAVYTATLLWLLTYVEGHRRLVRLVGAVTALALVLEMVVIVGAAAFGTTSHFNISSPLHALAWGTMGTAIVAVWLASLLAAVLLLRQRLPGGPAFAWGLRLGILVSLVGMAVAFPMTTPTPDQLAAAEAGRGLAVAGAHSVGVGDGGPGLPVVGWSTVGGDLRAGHFVGLHALQVLPLLDFLAASLGPAWLRPGHRAALVLSAGIAYLGLVLLLTWQALRGQSIVAPDVLTLGALAALAAAAATVALAVVTHARATAWRDR